MAASGSGTTVARLRIEFIGDLKGYQDSIKQAKTEGDAAAKTLGAALKDAYKPPAGGFLGYLIKDLKDGMGLTNSLKEAAKGLKSVIGSITMSALHTSATAVGKVLNSLKSAAKDVFKGLAIGAGIAAFQDLTRVVSDLVHVIPDLITQGREYGQMVADIIHTTGASGEEASKLVAAMKFLNPGEVNNMVQLMGQMGKNILGISATPGKLTPITQELVRYNVVQVDLNGNILKANGEIANQVEQLDLLRSGFSKMTDQQRKTQMEASLGGRGGFKPFADYFRLSDADWAKLVADWEKQGLIITTEQAKVAEDAGRESRRLGNAIAGIGISLFNALGPQINALLSTIADQVTLHMNDIKTAVGQAASNILGFVQGLIGGVGLVDAFTASIGNTTPAISANAMALQDAQSQLLTYDATQAANTATTDANTQATEAAAAATKANADALQAAKDAVDKQITALKALADQQDKTYRLGLAAINAELDAQLKLMDAQDAARAKANRDRDLAIQLAAAQEDLRKALDTSTASTNTHPGVVDFAAEEKAQRDIAAIRGQMAENVRADAEAANRAGIQSTKDYVAATDAILQNADLSQASKKIRLARQEAALRKAGAGGVGATADQTIELTAVLAAEKRLTDRANTDKKLSALDAKKAELDAETALVVKAVTTQKDTTRQGIVDQIAQYEKLVAEETKQHELAIAHMIGPAVPNDVSAFGSAATAAQKFGASVRGFLFGEDGKPGIVGGLTCSRSRQRPSA